MSAEVVRGGEGNLTSCAENCERPFYREYSRLNEGNDGMRVGLSVSLSLYLTQDSAGVSRAQSGGKPNLGEMFHCLD